jgi:hypothetical protein
MKVMKEGTRKSKTTKRKEEMKINEKHDKEEGGLEEEGRER